MSIILDVIVVGLIVLGIILGIKRGFVRTVIELAGYILVLIIAATAAEPISEAVYDSFIRQTVEESISVAISETAVESVEPTIDSVFENMPESLDKLLEFYSISSDTLKQSLGSQVDGASEGLAIRIADVLAVPIQSLIRLIFVALLFIIGLFVVRFLARFCNSVAKALPLVGSLNKALGGVAGALKGLAIAFFVANIFMMLLNLSAEGVFGITLKDAQASKLFSLLTTLA